jgi:signal transduction histidine kinase
VLVEAIVVAGLAVFVVAVYLVVVVGLVRPPAGAERDILLASVAAALVIAVLALPVRSRLVALGRSIVGRAGRPATGVLSSFSARMSRAVPMDELLLQLAESLQTTMGAAGAEVWVGSDGVLTRTVSVPHRASRKLVLGAQEQVVVGRARVGGDSWASVWLPELLVDQDGDRRPSELIRIAPAAHLGDLLGLLVVRRPAGSAAFSADEDTTLVELARQVALALHNVQLDSALQASLEEVRRRNVELQASRLRIVTTADESRRAIERNLHDGAQQHLVALAVGLRLLRDGLPADWPDLELLDELDNGAREAVTALRDLAHGIYPPLLRDAGLVAALRAVAARSPLDVTVAADGPDRAAEAVEAAVYFCCLEALQNVAKHAPQARVAIRIATGGGALHFTVADDGPGFDVAEAARGAGLQNMADRVGAVGGALVIRSAPGAGTEVDGRIPIGAGARDGAAVPSSVG